MAYEPHPGGGGQGWTEFTARIEARFGQQMKRPVWLKPFATADLPTEASQGANEGALAYDDTLNLPTYYTGAAWAPLAAYNANIASLATCSQGDLIYGSASNTWSKLSKNTTATRYLSNTGTSNNPAWAQINLANGVTGVTPVANGGTNASSASGTSLDNITGFSSTGMMARTGAGTYAFRTVTAATGSNVGITISNGSGVSGNPTIGIDSAMSTWTPTYSAGGGTLTTVTTNTARYKQLGNMVWFELDATLTNVGTGTGSFFFTLPVNAAVLNVLSGVETALTGVCLSVTITSATTVIVRKYDFTSILSNGNRLLISGWYEV